MTLQDIERLQREYAKQKATLEELKGELDTDVLALRKKYDGRLRIVLGRLTEAHSILYRAVAENPELFRKPRTIITEGIKAGMKMGKGRLSIEDSALTIKLIRKYFPDKADVLIRTIEEPAKTALQALEEADLKKIAVFIVGKEDQVIIEAMDSAVDKILNSALSSQIKELQEELKEAA